MKKGIVVFLCTLMSFSIFGTTNISAEVTPAILVESAMSQPGKTVQVDIYLQNNPGIVSMTLSVSFDTAALTLKNVQDGGILGMQSHKPQYNSPYTLSWVNDTALVNFTANGVIASLIFEVNESALIGDEYPIIVSYDLDNYDIYNKDIECVDFAVQNGSVTVNDEAFEPIYAPITDFSYRLVHGGIYITGYHGNDIYLQIPESYIINGKERDVTGIDESAFEGNETIASVILPVTIKSVGDYAFYDCISLKEVTLLNKNAIIGEKAFGYYYISRKKDGKVDHFTLTTYNGGTVSDYLSEHGMELLEITKPVGPGDVDADGEYTATDLVVLKQHLLMALSLTDEKLKSADLNEDGIVNILDLIKLKKNLIE